MADMRRFWDLLSAVLHYVTECWIYITAYQRSRDGIIVFCTLWKHCLDPNNVDNMANDTERKLKNIKYSGERKRWNFESYTRSQLDQH